ncbi:MAG TPA: hypothetical protein PKD64_15885 [Pirellulaceae bacterium]|nr:hypothetical protein [Pirellulaceae bacterium]HMO93668.1 hypothetical protein [Pirellulaceae bacterium]HMP68410.1 hypothetical protein [Pirellulaceae bacterium]
MNRIFTAAIILGLFILSYSSSEDLAAQQQSSSSTVVLGDAQRVGDRSSPTAGSTTSARLANRPHLDMVEFLETETAGTSKRSIPRQLMPAEVNRAVAAPNRQDDCYVVPAPMLSPSDVLPERSLDDPLMPWRDEYLIDGGDRGLRVQVDAEWRINGLDTEDTIAHFDTLSGKRLIQPSNRVGIYAPRFRAVRKITNLVDTHSNLQMARIDDNMILGRADSKEFSSTTKQNEQLQRNRLATSANAFRNQTRGVTADNILHLGVFDNKFRPFEDLAYIRYGEFSNNEKARLAEGIQRAANWSGDLEVLSTVSSLRLIEGKSVITFAEQISVKNQFDQPTLQLVKIANKMAAEVGEELEFTLRFDNVGNQVIGNVTIVDNLTGRLQYVGGSGQCSLDAELIVEPNDAGSSSLRWEITNPLDIGKGGIIRFKCIVR